MSAETITRKKIVELVMTLPEDRLASVYDFALFVQSHPLPNELQKMAREAAAEYRAGKTQPMVFASEGKSNLALERQHAKGYKKHPMKASEIEEWESEQAW